MNTQTDDHSSVVFWSPTNRQMAFSRPLLDLLDRPVRLHIHVSDGMLVAVPKSRGHAVVYRADPPYCHIGKTKGARIGLAAGQYRGWVRDGQLYATATGYDNHPLHRLTREQRDTLQQAIDANRLPDGTLPRGMVTDLARTYGVSHAAVSAMRDDSTVRAHRQKTLAKARMQTQMQRTHGVQTARSEMRAQLRAAMEQLPAPRTRYPAERYTIIADILEEFAADYRRRAMEAEAQHGRRRRADEHTSS